MEAIKKYLTLNNVAQIGLTVFTVSTFALTALKLPQYSLIVSLIAQAFWIYRGYKAWKNANQIGIFITSIIITFIVTYGIINYWFLS